MTFEKIPLDADLRRLIQTARLSTSRRERSSGNHLHNKPRGHLHSTQLGPGTSWVVTHRLRAYLPGESCREIVKVFEF
jgi:hypothetical protein